MLFDDISDRFKILLVNILGSTPSNTKELLIKHGLASMKRHMKVHSQVRMLDTTKVLNSSLEPLKVIGQDSITKVM